MDASAAAVVIPVALIVIGTALVCSAIWGNRHGK